MPEDLTKHLAHAIDLVPRDASFCVAYSGGADSTALLHALAHTAHARESGLRAVHVDHELHPDSARWAEHCARFCAALDVPIDVVRVEVDNARGEGLEAAARHARYAAFAQMLQQNEWLALAQHRDDQAETVLLKLLRGAGPHGLGGMRELRPFARGTLWRPLLDLPRAVLREYVNAHGLSFIDDPSNADSRLSRNFLRAEILPRLSAHWPQAAQSIAHSANLCRAVAEQIDAQIEASLLTLRHDDGRTLDAPGWSALPDALRALVLERWLHELGLPAPTQPQCAELRRQIDRADADRVPCITWRGAEAHVWHGSVHAMPPLPASPDAWQSTWNGASLALPAGCGTLTLQASRADNTLSQPAFDPPLTVRFRRGGERIKPAGDAHTRELRDLLQRGGIPPWQRGRLPLIYCSNELIAVADLWLSDRGETHFDRIPARPRWVRPFDSSPTLR